MAKREKQKAAGTCPFGKPAYPSKDGAQKASATGRAKRCGRCRQWHPE